MQAHKILNIASPDIRLQSLLHQEIKISKILAQILINRGIKTLKEADDFLHAGLNKLHDPFSFSQMPQAVEITKKAIKNKDKILIFSDYDVDGVTSLTILKETFSSLGVETQHYIPHRIKEGYGLNRNIIGIARQQKIKLIITADCGTSSYELIKELNNMGVEVIVTDHHEPTHKDIKSLAWTIINPKLDGSNYKYRDLAGVGVAYKFCQAISAKALTEELDLVALGTIADSVPLTGENRIIARQGLKQIFNTKRTGLKALMETSGISDKKMKTYFVSFILAPRINASGRMDTAETALRLLLSRHNDQALDLAKSMELQNRQRQKVERQILEEAKDIIEREINFKDHKILVVAKEGWHIGVLGVVASKLSDRFYRPAILISIGSSFCKGSGRSIKNFHLFNSLFECRELLENFGGHEHAVGLVIKKENIEDFKNKINNLAKERLTFDDLLPHFDIDMELRLSDLGGDIVRELALLEPIGEGNPEPLFYTKDLKLKGQVARLGRETIKFWVSDGEVNYQAIGFGMASLSQSIEQARNLDLIYSPRIDSWQNQESVILEIKDMFCR
jgi:single-stranded-DNA-specific exonuclease